jgi:RimJ/RimL family protein N-acetyltransferase
MTAIGTRQQVADNDGFQTAIVCDGSIVGAAGFHGVDWVHRSTSIGYWLDAAPQERHLNRVEIRAAPDNLRSRAIPERLGSRQEGVLREAERVGERRPPVLPKPDGRSRVPLAAPVPPSGPGTPCGIA